MLKRLRLNGAEALCKTLVERGIQVVFGIPGVHNLVLFEALRQSGIRVVSTTHEQGAAFMANGYGRATGKPGVFVTVPGPGLTNSLTPIAEALVDSTPMLAIVTDVPQSARKYQMHEIEQTRLAQPIVKSIHAVERASDISSALVNALNETTLGEPGPCILQIPANVFWDRVDKLENVEQKKFTASDTSKQIDEIVARLSSARRVGLLVGLGAADAADEVRLLAECMNAPVATTGSGRGIMDEAHPLSLGFGWISESIESVNRIFETCDLLLAIGVKFSQTGTQDFRLRIQCPLIHVDAASHVLGQNYKADIALAMDARTFLVELLKYGASVAKQKDEGLLELIRSEKKVCEDRRQKDTSTQLSMGNDVFTPTQFFKAMQKFMPPDYILVTDAGFNERLTLHNWTVHNPRTLINPSDYESMAFAIPTAIGASFAYPNRKVVAVIGDGGLVMSGLELMTAVREKVNLTVIVLNNHGFGIIKKIQEEMFGTSVAVDVGAPDFRALAESIRIHYQSSDNGIAALEDALAYDTPTIIEIEMKHQGLKTSDRFKKRLKNETKRTLRKIL